MSARPRALLRESFVFLAFVGLTAVMTWPWVLHLRDHASDAGDPYLVSWTLWWDFFQTFHDPLHLFHGNVFFPMKYSLAFSEHNYGIALPFFPLLALGVRPLTVHGLAILLGFAFAGYGAFRLTRTLTGSTGAAWVAGIAYAFVPYRFGQMPHLPYMFSGWIPVVLEALVLYVRERTPRRAAWLGGAFFLNGLAVIHWLILTLIPLAATGLALSCRNGGARDRAGLRRGALALGIAGLALLPFLLPYQKAAKLYGFSRGVTETRELSALPKDWLDMDAWNRTWRGFTEWPAPNERCLFPGLLLLLLPLAAVLLTHVSPDAPAPPEERPTPSPRSLRALPWLDGISMIAGTLALLASSPTGIHIRLGGREVFRAAESSRALAVFALALFARCWILYPKALPFARGKNVPDSLRLLRRPEAVLVGGIWAAIGFFGSLGMNFPFHRVLFETVFLFQSIRAPARWAMIAYLGLAVLAGTGAKALADAWSRRRGRRTAGMVFALLGLGLLFEDRAAPLELIRGEADPDEVTRFLAATPMVGGLVELPSGTSDHGNYRAVLRAADHRKPLVTAVSGFAAPIVQTIEEKENANPIPDDLLDFLEKIPTSYILVHDAWLSPETRGPHREWLARGLAAGRLLFVRRFDGRMKNDLYAVVKNEPGAVALDPLPWAPAGGPVSPHALFREDANLIGSIDAPPDDLVVTGPLRVTGWARIPGEDLHVTITIDGEERSPVRGARVPRPDVQRAVSSLGDCRTAGYDATYAFEHGDEGTHEVAVLFRSADGRQRHYPPRRFTWKR